MQTYLQPHSELVEQLARLGAQMLAVSKSLAMDKPHVDGSGQDNESIFRFNIAMTDYKKNDNINKYRPSLPDSSFIRQIIRNRQARSKFFDSKLFADPAWDMLLDLAVARVEKRRVSVTSLCIASGVPPTTALRWIGLLTGLGLLVRSQDDQDGRRAFVSLSDTASSAIAAYFASIDASNSFLV